MAQNLDMQQYAGNPLRRFSKSVFFLLGLVALTACARPATMDEIHDPFEATNRKVHAFNKSLDQAFLRPAGQVYVDVLPNPVEIGISNFSRNMDVPASVVNNLLQLDLPAALENTVRFGVNSTVGLLGLIDVAGEVGLYGNAADFGQTLDRWGVGEGPYLELPALGGSTGRDAAGALVDAMFNPLTVTLPDYWKISGPMVKSLAMVGDRGRFSDTVDSILYDSADSYAQARLFYLQSRRHELGLKVEEEDVFDPYEELYGDF
jgi:phospholipid-binding lipoprotein MlaA